MSEQTMPIAEIAEYFGVTKECARHRASTGKYPIAKVGKNEYVILGGMEICRKKKATDDSDSPEHFMTSAQLANRLGISKNSVRWRVRQGKSGIARIGPNQYVLLSELDELRAKELIAGAQVATPVSVKLCGECSNWKRDTGDRVLGPTGCLIRMGTCGKHGYRVERCEHERRASA